MFVERGRLCHGTMAQWPVQVTNTGCRDPDLRIFLKGICTIAGVSFTNAMTVSLQSHAANSDSEIYGIVRIFYDKRCLG